MISSKNLDDLIASLEGFGEGLGKQIHIIKYESITPDLFMLCFRTSGGDGNEHFFTALSYDQIYSIKHARKIIIKNFSKIIEFMPPLKKQKGRTELEQKAIIDADGDNGLLLARTERPSKASYWSSYITIMPRDEIGTKLGKLTKKEEVEARKVLHRVMSTQLSEGAKPDPSDFLKSWESKTSRARIKPEDLRINDTNLGINIYKNVSNEWEAFYNHVK